MRQERRTPRMADVASQAGVSHQTVSRVVNGSPNVSPETQAKVMAAIENLGYRPNRLARALVTQRSGVIGVAVARLGYYGPSSMVIGVDAAARRSGYGLQLATLDDDPSPGNVRRTVEVLVAEGAEAVVVITPERTGLSSIPGAALSVPVVMLNGVPQPGVATIGVDQVLGARQAVEHLISLGHKRIAHLAGPEGWAEATMRQEAWAAALKAAKLEPGPRVVGDWSAASGYRAARSLLEAGVTAIFSANDQMAIGLLRSLAEAGVDVPGQVSVVGFDDVPESGYLHPPLTTVRQDFLALGETAIELVLHSVENAGSVRAQQLPPTLVVRGSTGPAPA